MEQAYRALQIKTNLLFRIINKSSQYKYIKHVISLHILATVDIMLHLPALWKKRLAIWIILGLALVVSIMYFKRGRYEDYALSWHKFVQY